jgi:hypothetical protein
MTEDNSSEKFREFAPAQEAELRAVGEHIRTRAGWKQVRDSLASVLAGMPDVSPQLAL